MREVKYRYLNKFKNRVYNFGSFLWIASGQPFREQFVQGKWIPVIHKK